MLSLKGKLKQHGLFLRKTKSELPVSGWSTDCGEREGGGEGGAHSRIDCAANSRTLCGDSTAEHGVQFCHRLREEILRGNRPWRSASETG